MAERIRAACYCRVSTKKGEQLDSLEKQRAFFARFFENNPEYELYGLYADEGISAKSMRNRRQFQRMLADAQAGRFTAVFVKDVSRFARNVQDFFYALTILEDCGVRVHFVTLNLKSEQASRFTLGLMALLAEDESQRLSGKVKFGKGVTARRGRVPNFVFGYDRVDTYTLRPNPQEAEWVRRIFSLYVSEGMGAARIAGLLNDRAVPSKRGNVGRWTQAAVVKLLRNPLYIGKVVNLRTEVRDFKTGARTAHEPGHWAVVERPDFALVSAEIFEAAELLLTRRGQSARRAGPRQSAKHPLSNLLFCAEDGGAFRRVQRGGRASWVCSLRNSKGTAACANGTRVSEEELCGILGRFLGEVVRTTPKAVEKICAMAERILREKGREEAGNAERLLPALEARRRRFTELYADGLLSREEAAASIEPLAERIRELREKKTSAPGMNLTNRVTMMVEAMEMDGLIDNFFLKTLLSRIEITADGTARAALVSGKTFRLAACPDCINHTQGYVGTPSRDQRAGGAGGALRAGGQQGGAAHPGRAGDMPQV